MQDGKPRSRRLHLQWVTAGERRLISRALKAEGFSNRHIAELLEVSPTTVGKDLKPSGR